ncbi:MAG: DUF2791 family P-loop domain-containing protein, partial [Syntrophomonadaceae bacterium]|nr:DUF2791 family P-loop domain-containing protein [Syntrophomonadaceae bacterium]
RLIKVPFVGMPVEIDQLGRGKITKLIGKNALVAVDVLDGRQIEWPVSSIKPILVKDQVRFDTVVQPRVPVKTVKNDKISTLNRALESLRFGLVPEQYIEELTLGIEELNTWAQTCFARIMFNPRCGFEVNGPYGTGKSHTLALIRYLARKKGLLTARVEVDGQNVSLSNPAPLLYSLWNSLAENDLESENPLLNLYVKVIKRGNIPTSVINEDYDRIQNNIETIHTLMRTGYLDKYTHVVDAVISSSNEFTGRQAVKIITTEPNLDRSQIKLDNMIGHRVKERPYDFIESLAGHAMLAKLAGYKGLVVTIDEFETEHKDKKNLVRVE